MDKQGGDAPQARFGVLRLIALFKLSKVILLLATAYGVLRLRDASVIAMVDPPSDGRSCHMGRGRER